ncbi:MAG: heavy metal translocating P-type ATPase [Planctomycetes bacterium]|nr:heavy metal translocating P-type ATPase [Planctomycetota bacterium]
MSLTPAILCAHCGLPVPAGLVVDGDELQFCCRGCRTVYEAIHGAGLAGFYQLREGDDFQAESARTTGRSFAELDDPEFLAEQGRTIGSLHEMRFYLEGVHCAACVWLVEKLPRVLPGVVESRLDMGRSVVCITWDDQQVACSAIAQTLDRLGYPPHPYRGGEEFERRRIEDRRLLLRIAAAGALAGNVMAIAFALYGEGDGMKIQEGYRQMFRWASLLLAVIAVSWPGATFFRGALSAIRTRTPHMDLPIALGLGAGLWGGAFHTFTDSGHVYFESVTALVFFLLIGRFLQQRQQRAAWDALALLYSITPGAARLLKDGSIQEVPLATLQPGMQLEIRAGDSVSADGVIVEGASDFDLSMLTGESQPVSCREGDTLHAGTTNLRARVILEVVSAGADTRVGRLMKLVEQYARRPAAVVQLADRMAGWFTLIVLSLAGMSWFYWHWQDPSQALGNAVALLIVACPCALGLATPLALVAAVGRAARQGILIKGGDALERLSKPGTLLLDKTGTLTQGAVSLVRWQTIDAVVEHQLKADILAIEAHSAHLYAEALRSSWSEECEFFPTARGVKEITGHGIRGRIDKRSFLIGAPEYLLSKKSFFSPDMETALAEVLKRALTPVAIAQDGVVVALAGLGDPLKADAAQAMQRLRDMGWKMRILSGDHPQVAVAIGAELGLPAQDCLGAMTPEDKLKEVEQTTGLVVMVGDGVNDAAALAASDVGIAVHGGAEASLAAADIFLNRPGLHRIADLAEGSQRVMRVIRRNLAVSLAYNLIGVSLAFAGVLTPVWAAVLMPISSLTIVSLSWRARVFETLE